jgi:hypothetical protein
MNDDQILGFRAARLGLTADLPDLAAAADAQVGGQAQVEGPVCFGLSQRVAGRPDAETVRTALHEGVLVRAWGQRDTVHAYRPEDWPLVVAARPEWGKSARPHDPRALELADDAAALLASKDGAVRREDFLPLVTDTWLSEVRDDYFDTYVKKWRYCTGRLIWVLGNRGCWPTTARRAASRPTSRATWAGPTSTSGLRRCPLPRPRRRSPGGTSARTALRRSRTWRTSSARRSRRRGRGRWWT